MKVVKAVIVDLAEFAFTTVSSRAKWLLPARKSMLTLPTGRPSLLISSERLVPLGSIPTPIVDGDQRSPLMAQHQYVAIPHLTLNVYPTLVFDGVIAELAYGTEVVVETYEGRFASVSVGKQSGWVLKDGLRPELSDILPQFTVGRVYPKDDEMTERLRSAISDPFQGGALGSPLSAAEYVTYRLWQRGQVIGWGSERPRTPGSWQRLLRGVTGVYSGIAPKTGTVMEYVTDDIGQLAYVEAVAKDETIRLSSIDGESRYLEAELSKDAWRELRPVFIDVL